MRSRRRVLVVVAVVAVLALGAGVAAGSRLTSPADAAARTAAPAASQITVPVELRALLRWVSRRQEEGQTSTRDQIAKANSWNATASRRLVGSVTASS